MKNFSKFSYLMVQRLTDVLYLGPQAKIKRRGFLVTNLWILWESNGFVLVDGNGAFSTFLQTFLFFKMFDGAFYGPWLLFVSTWMGRTDCPQLGRGVTSQRGRVFSLETASFYMKYLVPVLNHTRSYFILKKSSKAELNNLVQPKIIKLLSYRQARNISKYLLTIRQSKILITI